MLKTLKIQYQENLCRYCRIKFSSRKKSSSEIILTRNVKFLVFGQLLTPDDFVDIGLSAPDILKTRTILTPSDYDYDNREEVSTYTFNVYSKTYRL